MRQYAFDIGRMAQSASGRQAKGEGHAKRHRFAVQETVREAGFGFQPFVLSRSIVKSTAQAGF